QDADATREKLYEHPKTKLADLGGVHRLRAFLSFVSILLCQIPSHARLSLGQPAAISDCFGLTRYWPAPSLFPGATPGIENYRVNRVADDHRRNRDVCARSLCGSERFARFTGSSADRAEGSGVHAR